MATSREPQPQFRPAGRPWTEERIGKLDRDEVEQLHENAINLGAAEVAALCAAALAHRPKQRAAACAKPPTTRTLVSRAKAFEARGVYLEDSRASWGGVRKSDGAVVMALWDCVVDDVRGEVMLFREEFDLVDHSSEVCV